LLAAAVAVSVLVIRAGVILEALKVAVAVI
jgi:hypothetical protein